MLFFERVWPRERYEYMESTKMPTMCGEAPNAVLVRNSLRVSSVHSAQPTLNASPNIPAHCGALSYTPHSSVLAQCNIMLMSLLTNCSWQRQSLAYTACKRTFPSCEEPLQSPALYFSIDTLLLLFGLQRRLQSVKIEPTEVHQSAGLTCRSSPSLHYPNKQAPLVTHDRRRSHLLRISAS